MSAASPLPLQPLPPPTLSQEEARALKQQVSSRLLEHRQRRPRLATAQPALPMEGMPSSRGRRVSDSVAARFAGSVSYRDFLQAEAETAIRRAEAKAEVARRNAEAVAASQQQLLSEIEQWNEQELKPEHTPFLSAASDLQTSSASFIREHTDSSATEAAPVNTLAAVASLQAGFAASHGFAEPLFRGTDAFEVSAEPGEPAVPLPANLIEFPRQLVAARRARPRLAEGPLREEADASPERAQLRIFEVEASSVSTEPAAAGVLPEWHTIRLGAQESARVAESPSAQVSLALPVYAAPVSSRLMAVTVDGCCIVSAFLAAVAVAACASPVLPEGLPAAIAAAGTLFTFGLLYSMLFFTLNDATPGMRYARIGLCTFSDNNPTRSSMRRRCFAILLAGMPLGLGLVWACMDEDGLGWHDRISRMYPREY